MGAPADPKSLLPSEVAAAIEERAGARIIGVIPRAGGGASHEGAEVELEYPDGARKRGFLRYNVARGADPLRRTAFRREQAILKALSGPLVTSGVRAPPLLAGDERYLALLMEFVAGDTNYNGLPRGPGQDEVSRDFLSQLAQLHKIDITTIELDGFPPPAPASVYIKARIAEMRARHLASVPDAIILLALDWLAQNVPTDPVRTVLVHGDAGPGNFIFADGKITALIDWELVHFGDPMEDLAMLCIRNLFQPFMPMREAFAIYEAAGGAKVDIARVRYHRLYSQLGFMVGSHSGHNDRAATPPPDYGMHLVYHTAHMRVMVESLAELMGLELPAVDLAGESAHMDRSYDVALADLRDVIVPRSSDQQASQKAKGLARMIKYWRAIGAYGAAFEAAEMRETAAALACAIASSSDARRRLAEAVATRAIAPGAALMLVHRRMARETMLMADAMGRFAQSHYAALD